MGVGWVCSRHAWKSSSASPSTPPGPYELDELENRENPREPRGERQGMSWKDPREKPSQLLFSALDSFVGCYDPF